MTSIIPIFTDFMFFVEDMHTQLHTNTGFIMLRLKESRLSEANRTSPTRSSEYILVEWSTEMQWTVKSFIVVNLRSIRDGFDTKKIFA
jgi:hypothetical protein